METQNVLFSSKERNLQTDREAKNFTDRIKLYGPKVHALEPKEKYLATFLYVYYNSQAVWRRNRGFTYPCASQETKLHVPALLNRVSWRVGCLMLWKIAVEENRFKRYT